MSIEHAYLHLLESCLSYPVRETRNAKCHSMFGAFLEHDLSEGFPLLTTKKVFFRGVVEELAWFLRGSTSNQELMEKGVSIWQKNAEQYDPEFHDELGAIYGFNWRNFGAKYVDCKTDYTDQGWTKLRLSSATFKNSQTHADTFCRRGTPPSLHACPPVTRCTSSTSKTMDASPCKCINAAVIFFWAPFQYRIDRATHASDCPRVQSRGWHHAHHHRRRAHICTACRSGAGTAGQDPKALPKISVVREKDGLAQPDRKKMYVY